MVYSRKNSKGDSERLLIPKKSSLFSVSKSMNRSDDLIIQNSSKRFTRFAKLPNDSFRTPPLTPEGSDGPMIVTVITTKGSPPNSPPRDGQSIADTTISDLSASIVRSKRTGRYKAVSTNTFHHSALNDRASTTPEKERVSSASCVTTDYQQATEAIYKSLFGMMEQACQVMPSTTTTGMGFGLDTSMETEPISNKSDTKLVVTPAWGLPPSDDEYSDEDDSLFRSLATKTTQGAQEERPPKERSLHENFELVLDPDAWKNAGTHEKKRWWNMRKMKDFEDKMEADQDAKHRAIFGEDPNGKKSLGDFIDDASLELLNGEDLLTEDLLTEDTADEGQVQVTPKQNGDNNTMKLTAVLTPPLAISNYSPPRAKDSTAHSPSKTLNLVPEKELIPIPKANNKLSVSPAVTSPTSLDVPRETQPRSGDLTEDVAEHATPSSFISLSLTNPFAALSRIGSGGKDKKLPTSVPAAPPVPKPVWKEALDPTTGRTYYYHRLTRKATWTKPSSLRVDEESGVEILPEMKEFGTSARKDKKKRKTKTNVPKKTKELNASQDKIVEHSRSVDVSAEKQRKIEEGDFSSGNKYSILKKKTLQKDYTPEDRAKKVEITQLLAKMAPPDSSSIVKVMQQYDGREDELLDQLRDMVESKPFDEPIPTAHSYCSSELPPDEERYMETLSNYADHIENSVEPVVSHIVPFAKPVGPLTMQPNSPLQVARMRTSQSNVTGVSNRTERTEQTAKAGNLMGVVAFEPIAEEHKSTATDLSSDEECYLPISARIARVTPRISVRTSRTRELRVEEFSSSSLGLRKERFNDKSNYSPPRTEKQKPLRIAPKDSSRRPSPASNTSTLSADRDEAETDAFASDSVSALSQSDIEFNNRKENFDKARRKALDLAIRKKDWQTAAEVTNDIRGFSRSVASSRTSSTDTASAEEWTQGELDQFISENDWDAVAKYIAYMRDSNCKSSRIPPRPTSKFTSKQQIPIYSHPVQPTRSMDTSSASSSTSAYHKKFGARSQLQHNELHSVSSWESESESSEYSSASYDDTLDEDEPRKRNFAC